jgi:hypothetical protein
MEYSGNVLVVLSVVAADMFYFAWGTPAGGLLV